MIWKSIVSLAGMCVFGVAQVGEPSAQDTASEAQDASVVSVEGYAGDSAEWYFDVPLRRAPKSELEEAPRGDWMTYNGQPTVRELEQLPHELADEWLELRFTSHNGYAGNTICLRLQGLADGRVTCSMNSSWSAHVGSEGFGFDYDLVGTAMLTDSPDGTEVQLDFRLNGLRKQFASYPEPVLIEGGILFPKKLAPWSWDGVPAVEPPASEAGALLEVQVLDPGGVVRAAGSVDERGLRQGVWCTFDAAGKPGSESTFLDGEHNGPWVAWNPSGESSESGMLRAGLREGTWIDKSSVGGGVSSVPYRNGQRHGDSIRVHPNGRVRSVESYVEGRLEGEVHRWWANGKRLLSGTYTAGRPSGTWTHWDEQGDLLRARER